MEPNKQTIDDAKQAIDQAIEEKGNIEPFGKGRNVIVCSNNEGNEKIGGKRAFLFVLGSDIFGGKNLLKAVENCTKTKVNHIEAPPNASQEILKMYKK
jgi:hypothetical protein